jgi:hypothetical protein
MKGDWPLDVLGTTQASYKIFATIGPHSRPDASTAGMSAWTMVEPSRMTAIQH